MIKGDADSVVVLTLTEVAVNALNASREPRRWVISSEVWEHLELAKVGPCCPLLPCDGGTVPMRLLGLPVDVVDEPGWRMDLAEEGDDG